MSLVPDCSCLLCGNKNWRKIAAFDKPQPNEKSFGVDPYYRELWQCINCGLFVNRHDHDISQIYDGAYRSGAYETQSGSRFQKIMELPFAKSDNKQRIGRINDYVRISRPQASHLLREALNN